MNIRKGVAYISIAIVLIITFAFIQSALACEVYLEGNVTYCGCTPCRRPNSKSLRNATGELKGTSTTDSSGYYRQISAYPYGTNITEQNSGLQATQHFQTKQPFYGKRKFITIKLISSYLVCGEGFTLGFWRNHLEAWVTYTPSMLWTDVFEDPISIRIGKTTITNPTLGQAIMASGGINQAKGVYDALARHAVAALLNAAHPDVDYPMTEAEIISAVNEVIGNADYTDAQTLKNTFDACNNLGAQSKQPLKS